MSWTHPEPGELELSAELTAAVGKLRAKSPLCPKPELLQAARSGVLPPDLAEKVNRHLDGCRLCQSMSSDLEALDSASAELDAAGRKRIWKRIQAGISGQNAATNVRAQSAWWSLWLRPLPVAATAVAAIALAFGIRLLSDRQPSISTARTHTPASLPAPSVFRLEKVPVVLPASAAIVWRGRENPFARQSKDLKQALAPYELNNYAQSAQRLQRLRKKYPRMAEAPFYLGVCQLFLNENEDAARSLQDAVNLAGPPLADEAAWYLALAQYRTGKTDVASSLLEPVCHSGGKDSGRACAGIKELEARH